MHEWAPERFFSVAGQQSRENQMAYGISVIDASADNSGHYDPLATPCQPAVLPKDAYSVARHV